MRFQHGRGCQADINLHRLTEVHGVLVSDVHRLGAAHYKEQ